MKYNLNAAIALKRLIDLNNAKEYIGRLGISADAVNKTYQYFRKPLDIHIDNMVCSDTAKTVVTFGDDSIELCCDLNSKMWIDIIFEEYKKNDSLKFAQFLLQSTVMSGEKGMCRWRIVDPVNAGASVGKLSKIVSSDKNLFGGKFYCTDDDIRKLRTELESVVKENIKALDGKYDSVFEFNANEDKYIPLTVVAIFDYDQLDSRTAEMFEIVENNYEKAGIIIIRTMHNKDYSDEKALKAEIDNNSVLISAGDVVADCKWVYEELSDECIKDITAVKKINTLAENYIDLSDPPLKNYTGEGIRIPFAVDNFGKIYTLDLSGNYPAHALFSGMTGSGKSVLLHTVVESVCFNYHPDDVELWLVDYKAVEFNNYIYKRTPHISLIGQDNSRDFTYGLLDKIYEEYSRRKKLFVDSNAKGFSEYRKIGNQLPLLMIIIDEFHNMTQAVKESPEYMIMLENLLSEMRALGMVFIFCDQAVSMGLNGLTEKGKNQIGCRLCMQQQTDNEIRECLNEKVSYDSPLLDTIKNFQQGEIIYKWFDAENSRQELTKLNVLYIRNDLREKMIDAVYSKLDGNYQKRKEIICKNSERYHISEKTEHSLNRFIRGESINAEDNIFVYPAAPTNLDDEYRINIDNSTGKNILLCGNDDDIRESIMIFSLLGLLADEKNIVNVSVLDNDSLAGKRIISYLSKIRCERLNVYKGGKEVFDHILTYNKLKPQGDKNITELMYGIQKVKSVAFLLTSDDEEQPEPQPQLNRNIDYKGMSVADSIASYESLLAAIDPSAKKKTAVQNDKTLYTFDNIVRILSAMAEYGPDIGIHTFLVLNSIKHLKQLSSKLLEHFEYRLGLKMSEDDSYEMFGISSFIRSADEKTAVLYTGSKQPVTLRPYIMPDDEFFNELNRRFLI